MSIKLVNNVNKPKNLKTAKNQIKSPFWNQEIAAPLAWQLAATAQRINQGYVKTKQFNPATKELTLSNNMLMTQLLSTPELITDEDREFADQVHSYFKNLIIRQIAGQLGRFLAMAFGLATLDSFKVGGRDWPLLAVLPATYISEMHRLNLRQTMDQLIEDSKPMGNLGQLLNELPVTIISCEQSKKFKNYAVNAIDSEGHVLFFFNYSKMPLGAQIINARIKAHYQEKTTQLDQVRLRKL